MTAHLEIPSASLVLRRADRAGAAVARAAVPARDRRTATPAVDDHDTRSLAAAVAAPARFDSDLLSRATRSLEAGPSWNAFGPGQTEQVAPAPQAPEPSGTPAGPRVRQRVPGASLHATAAPTRPVDATAADPAAARALVEAFQAGVRRAEAASGVRSTTGGPES